MEIRELRSFVVLGEHLHFGRAAGILNLSQPALTKQIRKLEEELGSQLFERGKQGTQLTSFGRKFLAEAREVVHAFDDLEMRGKRAARGETGTLNIGFGFHTFELVPRIIMRLRQEAPGIRVSLRDMSTQEQVVALNRREMDLGFARIPIPGKFQSMPVVRDRLAIISSPSSHLPKRLTLAQCRDEPFVALSEERAPGFHQHVLSLCAQHGFHPRMIQQVAELTTIVALVRAGLGVAVVPESFQGSRIEGVRFHPIGGEDSSWQVSAVWHTGDTNPALQKFLDLLRDELGLE